MSPRPVADAGNTLTVVPDSRDLGILKNLRAAGTRAFGQRLRDVDSVSVAVRRDMHAAEHVIRVQQRDALRDLVGRDHVYLQFEHLGHGGIAFQLLESGLGGGDGNRTALPVAGCLTGFGLQLAVQITGVAGELRHIHAAAKLPDQAGRMPRRAGGDLFTFDQYDI